MADPGEPPDPTAHPLIGPATADVLEAAPFSATDVAEGRVSYRMLLDAGINPGVAERLRREYSLVWAFRWRPGEDDLPERAGRIRSARRGERDWITTSGAAGDASRDGPPLDEPQGSESDTIDREWPEVPPAGPSFSAGLRDRLSVGDSSCPRCGAGLETLNLEGSETVFCEECGFSGVDLQRDEARARRSVERAVDEFLAGERSD